MKSIFRKHLFLGIFLFVILIVLAAGVFFFTRFIQRQSVKVHQLKEDIATYEVNKRSFSEEAQQIKELQGRLQTLEGYVVSPATLPSLLSTLESRATEEGVIFQITGVATPTEQDQKKLRIDFSLSGSLPKVRAFLELLLSQPFAAAFTRLEFTADPQITPLDQVEEVPVTGGSWRVIGTLEILSF